MNAKADTGAAMLSYRPSHDPLREGAELIIRLRTEAKALLDGSPQLHGLLDVLPLEQDRFELIVLHRIATALASAEVSQTTLVAVGQDALASDPGIAQAMVSDLVAVLERDPAADRAIQPLLFFKGFAAIECHRIAHRLWRDGRRDIALYLQSKSSEVFQTDIHPAVRIGSGVFLDHATGFVAGQTAEIGNNVSILQGVTLGGTGTGTARRHPKIHDGVMIGAGATILGPIVVGSHSRVAAGSVVIRDVPSHATAVGVPARIIPHHPQVEPSRMMDQVLADTAYEQFTYTI